MKKINKARAQFEERYPIPSGMRWEPTLGQQEDYILDCSGCCSGVVQPGTSPVGRRGRPLAKHCASTTRFLPRWVIRMRCGLGKWRRSRCGIKV